MVEAVSRYRSWIGWGIAVLAGFALVLLNPFGYDGQVLPKVLAIRLAVLAMAALWVVAVCFEGSLRIRRTPLDFPALGMLAAWGLATALAVDKRLAFYGDFKSYDGFLTLLAFVALFYLATSFLNSQFTERLTISLLISSGAIVAYGIVQYFGLGLISDSPQVSSAFESPLILGAFLSFAIPFAVAAFLSTRSNELAAMVGALVLAGVFLLVVHGTVEAWLAAAIALLALAVGARRMIHERKGRLAAVAVLVVIAVVSGVGASVATKRLNSLSDFNSRMKKQAAVWRDGIKLVVERPITGFGPDNLHVAYYKSDSVKRDSATAGVFLKETKSGLLDNAVAAGLIGELAFLVFCGFIVVVGYKVSKNSLMNSAFWSGAVGLLSGYLVFGAYSSTVAVLFWLSAAVLGAASSRSDLDLDILSLKRVSPTYPIVLAAIVVAAAGYSFYRPLAADLAVHRALNPSEDESILEPERNLGLATSLNPGEKSYWLALGQMGLKLAAERSDPDEAREAEAALDKAAALDSYDPNVHLAQGRVFMSWAYRGEKSKLPKAIDSFKKAIALDPLLVVARYELGMAYASQDKLELAIETWKEATKRDKDNEAIWYALGMAYDKKGDVAGAEKTLRQALNVSKDDAVRSEIEAKLKEISTKREKAPAEQ